MCRGSSQESVTAFPHTSRTCDIFPGRPPKASGSRRVVGSSRGVDARALGRSFHRVGVHATLQDAGTEPLANQPQDSRVGNPVRQHPQQPVVVNAVEVSADVGIEYPVTGSVVMASRTTRNA